MPPSTEPASGASRRILHVSRFFYFDSTNGASVANRALMEGLARRGLAAEVVSGTIVDAGGGASPSSALGELFLHVESLGSDPPRLVGQAGGIAWTALDRPLQKYVEVDPVEARALIRLAEDAFERFRPDVLVTYGGDPLTLEILDKARQRGIATVFTLHNFGYPRASTFADVDAVLVPSRFSAEYHRRALSLDCTAIPYLVDHARAVSEVRDPRYVTMVNPSIEKGVYAFARIADELGRRRPDIPLLVVEGRGTERTLADCGLDLPAHGNVNLMAHTPDPRRFWGVTKVCLLPSLWWENQPLVAVEAMLNGIPVIGSDRGGIPETLGGAGIVLPLPERLTPSARELPTPGEVAPWVEAIIRLWDDPEYYTARSHQARQQGQRWDPEVVEPLYARFFAEVRPKPRPMPLVRPAAPSDRPARRSIEEGIEAIRRRWPDLGDDRDDDTPVFILSAGWRSGSTLLQRLVFGPWFLWGEPFGHAGLVESLAEPIRCFTDAWPEPHHFHEGEGISALGGKFIANLYPSVRDLREAHRAYFRALFAEPARRAGSGRWGFKEVRLGVDHAIYLKWLFPRAKFLFLIRNPYDAWRSFAARAARGWKWYKRWPDEPVTVRSFAAHWRQLVSSFLDDHAKVGGLVVRYETLLRGDYAEIERYLGHPLSREAARVNPGDGGPPPLTEILAADRVILDEELGTLAATLGYGPDVRADAVNPATEFGSVEIASVPTISTAPEPSAAPARCVILVPVGTHVEPACDDALRALERRGYTVRRVRGYSAIDQGRNQIATDALRDGFEELLWVDSDIAFDPEAVERLRSHGLPITCGVYPKKSRRSFACNFPGDVKQVAFGKAGGLIEIPYAGAGFLHTRREVYQIMQERLRLPSCNERFGPSMVPFFQPTIVPEGQGQWYLAEDFAFCHRARACGFRIMADTTIRLRHIGSYAYSWEDAGGERQRYGNFTFHISD